MEEKKKKKKLGLDEPVVFFLSMGVLSPKWIEFQKCLVWITLKVSESHLITPISES